MSTIPTVPVPASDQDLTPTVVAQPVTSVDQAALSECTASIIPVGAAPQWPGLVAKPTMPAFHKAGHDFCAPNYESATLSCLLNYPDNIEEFSEGLSTEHFYDEPNRELFFAIVHLHNNGVKVTPDAVVGYFEDTDIAQVKEWLEYISAICAVAVNPKHVGWYKARLSRAVALRGGDSYYCHEFSEAFCAELLLLQLPNVCCIGAEWREYRDGVWEKKDRNIYRKAAREVIHPGQRQARRITDLISHVESARQVGAGEFYGAYKMVAGRILINANNGVIEVGPGDQIAFRAHSPDDRFTLKLATDYIPEARCDRFDLLLIEALPDPQDRKLLQCSGGNILYPGCDHETALVLFGPGETGKSTIAGALRSALGTDLCGSIGLDVLCNSSSYSLPSLKFKMLNLGSELKGTEIEESSNFKKLVSGEYLNARAIYAAPEEMRTTAKLMFLSNHVPRFSGGTDAELRRMRMIEFSRKPAVKDLHLKTKLEAEASGILNWMLEGLTELLQEGAMPRGGKSSEQLLNVFSKSNDPVGRFVDECCELSVTGEVNKDVLVAGFTEWCHVNGIVMASDRIESYFYKTLKNRFPQLKHTRRRNTRKGYSERLRFVLGLRLVEKGSPLMPKEVGEEFEDALLSHTSLEIAGQIETANSRNDIGAPASDEQGVEDRQSHQCSPLVVPGNLINDGARLVEIAGKVVGAETVAFDIETYGDPLNPWRGDIRILSLSLPDSPPWLLDLKALGYGLGPLRAALESTELIGHNAKFDALWLRVKCGLDLPKLYCTCTASRLLTAGSRAENSLDACLATHLNVSVSKTQGGSDWGSMLLTPEQLAYCSNDVAYLHDLRKALDQKLRAAGLEKVAELEMALLPVVTKIEATGFAVDRGRLTALRDKAREETACADTELRNIIGQSINPASPKQLLAALHARGIRLRNTDEDSLANCKDTTVVPIIRRFRTSEKRRQGTQKLLDAIESDGRIHAQFNSTGTDTGRFSCTQPNLQAIERGEMRECFTAAEGSSLIVADYSQIELRVAAAIAPEPAMIAAYKASADLHVQTARIILKKSSEEAVTSEERRLAKAINFGLLYGQSAKGLVGYLKSGFQISISEAEAKRFVARFFGVYSGLNAWQEKCRRLANDWATREIRSALGRRRLLPSGRDEFWPRYTCALNMPVQGGCGDGLKRAMLRLSKILPIRSQIVSAVHDELIVEAPVEEADAVKAVVEREMVDAMTNLYPTVRIEVEAKVCRTWGEK